jgi:hypothetical protein
VHAWLRVLSSPLRSLTIDWRLWMLARVMLHIVMRCVGRVLLGVRVRRAGCLRNRWIYRNIRVRLVLLLVEMII